MLRLLRHFGIVFAGAQSTSSVVSGGDTADKYLKSGFLQPPHVSVSTSDKDTTISLALIDKSSFRFTSLPL